MAARPWSDIALALGALLTALGLIGRALRPAGSGASDTQEPDDSPGVVPVGRTALRGAPATLGPRGSTRPRATRKDIDPIKGRLGEIAKLIRKAGVDPEIHEATKKILSMRGPDGDWLVKPKDWENEVKLVFRGATDPRFSNLAVRYVCDMLRTDTFSSAKRTLLQTHGGDCDDFVIVLGGMCESVGYQVKIRCIQAKGKSTWSHVYLLVGIPPGGGTPTQWMPLDGSVETKPPGWQAPGAESALRYGKPSGMVARTLDLPV